MMCLIFVLIPSLHDMGGACDHGKRKDHQGKLEGRPEVPLLQDLPFIQAFRPRKRRYEYLLSQRYAQFVLLVRRKLRATA